MLSACQAVIVETFPLKHAVDALTTAAQKEENSVHHFHFIQLVEMQVKVNVNAHQ